MQMLILVWSLWINWTSNDVASRIFQIEQLHQWNYFENYLHADFLVRNEYAFLLLFRRTRCAYVFSCFLICHQKEHTFGLSFSFCCLCVWQLFDSALWALRIDKMDDFKLSKHSTNRKCMLFMSGSISYNKLNPYAFRFISGNFIQKQIARDTEVLSFTMELFVREFLLS